MIDNKSPAVKGTWLKLTLMTILAILIVVLGIPGLLGFGYSLFRWIAGGFDFGGFSDMSYVLFGVGGALFLLVAMALSGIFLRFVPWQTAPLLSLVLSALSVGLIFLAYGMFVAGEIGENDREGFLLMQGIGLGCFLFVSLPLFLHWLRASKAA